MYIYAFRCVCVVFPICVCMLYVLFGCVSVCLYFDYLYVCFKEFS
jgi:hypothetical protein